MNMECWWNDGGRGTPKYRHCLTYIADTSRKVRHKSVLSTHPSIHVWRYCPFRALASLKACLHSSLFSALLLHPLTPSSYNASLCTTSAHLVLGLPTGLVLWHKSVLSTHPSIHVWHYSPFRALISLKACLHSSLFSGLLLHPLTPSSYNASLCTTSAHLVLGLPTGLVLWKVPFKIFFGILSSSIVIIWTEYTYCQLIIHI